jgi:hypothetical protein
MHLGRRLTLAWPCLLALPCEIQRIARAAAWRELARRYLGSETP